MKRLAAALLGFYRREPARCNTYAAAALSWLLLKVGLDVDDDTVLLVATSGLAIAAGELTRAAVMPKETVSDKLTDARAEARAEGRVTVVPLIDHTPHATQSDWQPASPNARKPQA